MAEEMGLIVEIGNLVLQRSLPRVREMARRRARGRQHVADPVPARQCRRRHSRGACRGQLPASRLEIEITESVLLNDTELRAIGSTSCRRWACASRSTISAPATRA